MTATAADIVEFLEIPGGSAFDVAPEKAIEFFKAKGLQPSFSYAEMLGEAHVQAFTVAKMMDVDMLGQLKDSLENAQAVGQSFEEWKDSIVPILQAGGWWGRKEVVDPVTGKTVVAQLGSPSRLETIFRTNMQSAYAAGQWQQIQENKKTAPFLMYDAVDDFRTRPLHASWDRRTLKVDSPWWNTHYPPNGWNCRCGVIQLTQKEVESLGLQPIEAPPSDGTYVWTNPRTGQKHEIPEGVDPGFDVNVGKTHVAGVKKVLAEKVKAKKIAAGKALAEAMAQQTALVDQAQAAVDSASEIARKNTVAAQLRANQTSDAALAKAKKRADQALVLQAAKDKLAAIASGKYEGKGKGYLQAAYQKLKGTGVLEQPADEALFDVQKLADLMKLKTETASKLATYKKAVLEGKIPAPSLVKALKSLPEEDQAAFLAKLQTEQTKLQIAKQKAAQAAAIAAAEKAAAEKAAQEAAAAAAAPKTKAAVKKTAPKAASQAPAAPSTPLKVLISGASHPPDPAKLIRIGNKTKGSNPGGLFQDPETGTKWLLKFPDSMDTAQSEALAGRLYQLAGVNAPELHAITFEGKPAIASRIVEGIQEVGAAELKANQAVLEGFGADAWLANWDSVGLAYDNTVLVPGGAIRIDVGGSLEYRAQGGLKGDAFGNVVNEIDTLRDPRTAPQASQVFGGMGQAQLERAVAKVIQVSDADIRATVEAYGPGGAAERRALADKLIARKQDLARRFPNALKTEAPAPVAGAGNLVSPAEVEAVKRAGLNGYVFRTDSGDIEDHSVQMHHYVGADGKPRTRAWAKLRPVAGRRLAEQLGKEPGAGPSVDMALWRSRTLEAIKGISLRASKGQNFDAKDISRLDAAITEGVRVRADFDKAFAELKAAGVSESSADFKALRNGLAQLNAWDKEIRAKRAIANVNTKAVKFPATFPASEINNIPYTLPVAAPKNTGLPWKSTKDLRLETVDATSRKVTGNVHIPGVSGAYEAELPDGTRVRYVRNDQQGTNAMRGAFWVDVVGDGKEGIEAAFRAIEKAGVSITRATEEDRQLAYLNAFASLRYAKDRAKLRGFVDMDESWSSSRRSLIEEKLRRLKADTGVDIANTQGWREVQGTPQAFDSGRLNWRRPDLESPEFAKFAEEHRVYHNPNGLGGTGSSPVASHVEAILSSGGAAASQVDRIRRGVFTGSGSSVWADFNTGGADFFFTRIQARSSTRGTGFHWKPRVLRRMDAVTYDGDNFGGQDEYTLAQRRGQNVSSFISAARSGSNETIFKNGLSFFEDMEEIVCASQADRTRVIAAFKKAGYTKWPDGRALESVITVR